MGLLAVRFYKFRFWFPLVHLTFFSEGDFKMFKEVFDINLLGLTNCTQQALKLMKESKVDDGHIIFINSVAGHYVPRLEVPASNVYAPSKHAVRALVEALRQELVYLKSKIKVTVSIKRRR